MVAVLDGPKVEGKTGKFVDFRDRCGITLEIDDQEVALAAFAREQPHVRKLCSCETRDGGFRRFVAAGTARAWKRSPPQAQRANQLKGETIALRMKTAGLRRLSTPGAIQTIRKACSVGLQRGTHKKLVDGKVTGAFPVVAE